MNERELRLLRGIRDSLIAIQKEIHSIRDQQERNNENAKPPAQPPILRAELQIPERAERSNQTNSNRDHRTQVWLTVGTWLAFIAAAIYAGVAKGQLEKMRQQTELIQREVEATAAAVITREFRASWGKHMRVTLLMNNRGKTTASSVHGSFKLVRFSLTKKAAVDSAEWPFPMNGVTLIPDRPAERGVDVELRQEDLTSANKMEEAIRLTGTFGYFNGFRNVPEESVCYYLLGPMTFTNKGGSVQTNGPITISCDDLPRIQADIRDQMK